jgi:hypothetical protein
MNRRTFLSRVGAAVSISGLAGCSLWDDSTAGQPDRTPSVPESPTSAATTAPETPNRTETETPTPPLTRRGITFETVLHAVDDLGMDPSGERPIDAALDEAYGEERIVVFPPGTYLATEQHVWNEDIAGFGMVGLGETERDVQFVFPRGNRGAPDPANYWFLRVESGRDHLLENVTVQQSDDVVTGVGMVFYLADGLQIHDVELAGFNPAYGHDPGFGIVAAITTRAGVGVVEGFTCTGGGVVDVYPKRKIPIASYHNHRGELRVLDAHIANAGEHSLYVSRTRGCVRVEDGLFVNNDNSNLRMSGGGHPEKRSWAKNCDIVIDTENARRLPEGERYQGARGIWVEAGGEYDYGHTDLLLEDIDVAMLSNARPAVLLLHEHSHGALTVRNGSFRSEVEGATVVDSRFPYQWVQQPYGLTLDGVDVRTSATQTVSGYAVRVDGRPDSVLRDIDVGLVAGSVNGVLVESADGASVIDTDITTRVAERPDYIARWDRAAMSENVGIVVRDTRNYTIEGVDSVVPGRAVRVDQPALASGRSGSESAADGETADSS